VWYNNPTEPAQGTRRHAHSGHLCPHSPTFSFEFFPPKTEQASEELFRTIASLQELQPSFVSVTYGAGGSSRDLTHDLVVRIEKETDLTAVSHLTCVCHNLDEMTAILDRYATSGIMNILALSGDLPAPGRTTTARRTRSGTPTSSYGSSGAGRTRRTRAASGSAWRASRKGTPAARTGSRRWTT